MMVFIPGLLTALSLFSIASINVVAHPTEDASATYDKLRINQISGQPVFIASDSRGLAAAQRDGFEFENPSVNCKYTSQPKMYDMLSTFAADTNFFFTMVHENVDWTIVGHHPLAGHYPTSKLFFVNTLWRLRSAFDTTRFYVRAVALHAGCNSPWSVQELDYHGSLKGGETWQLYNTWVTRWENDRIVESRAYVDAPTTMGFLRNYEVWWNSTTDVDHTSYLPGPQGMPPLPPD